MLSFRPKRLIVVSAFLTLTAVAFVRFGPASKAQKINAPLAPTVTATETAAVQTDTNGPNGLVNPGDTIQYTVTLNNGAAVGAGNDAANIFLSDTISANQTLVGSSIKASPIAIDDTFAVTGNVRISAPAASLISNDIRPVTGNNTGLTVTAITKSSTKCTAAPPCTNNVVIAADGSFTYDPPPGFTGSAAAGDTFTYTITDPDGLTGTGTVTMNVTGTIWFVQQGAAAGGDGRLTHPFNCLVGAGCFNGSANLANDNIFLYSGSYTGGLTLKTGQKLIGQGAGATLISITGLTVVPNSDALPATGGANPVLTTGSLTDNIALGTGNTLRGFTIGDSGGVNGDSAKLKGTSFGTLTVNEVTLSGTGRTLALTTGTFASGSAFTSITTTKSNGQGMTLSGVGGSVTFGTTTISGHAIQCISVETTTADINFGNTTCTGGGEGIALNGNSAGTRTFGTLSMTGGTANGFIHSNNGAVGGGNVTITDNATISCAGNAISVSNPANGNQIDFQGTTNNITTTGAGVTGINWVGAAGATMQFASLSITRNNGTALNATTGGTISVTNPTGSITNTTAAGPAITAANVTLNAKFATINSTAGTNLVNLNTVAGTSDFGGGVLTGTVAGSDVVQIQNGSLSLNYSGTITNNGGGKAVLVQSETGSGTVNFSGLITDASAAHGQGVAMISNSAGTTVNYTGGINISTTSSSAFTATGGGTVTATQNNTSIVNTITSTTSIALNVVNTALGVSGLTFRSISANGGANGIVLNNTGIAAGSGGLTVTGNGSTCTVATPTCDGGSIQSSTATGISLTSTKNVSLTRMKIQNSGTVGGAADHEIGASTVNGFSIDTSIITDTTGDATLDDGINLSNTTGAISITSTAISGARHQGITIDSTSGTISGLTMTGSTITGTPGGDGMLIQMRGTSVMTGGNIGGATAGLGNTFSSNSATGLQINNADTGNLGTSSPLNIQNNIFTGNNAGTDMDLGQSSSYNIIVQNNTYNGHHTTAINAVQSTSSTAGTLTLSVKNNTIGTQGTVDSGSAIGTGIRIANGGVTVNLNIDGNMIREVPNGRGIDIEAQAYAVNNNEKVKITNNTIVRPTGTNQNIGCGASVPCPSASIFVLSDSNGLGGFDKVCSVVNGNSAYDPTSWPAGGEGAYYFARRTSASNILNLEGNTAQSPQTNVLGANTVTNSTSAPFIDENTSGTVTVVAAGTCGSFPTRPEIAQNGSGDLIDSPQTTVSQTELAGTVGQSTIENGELRVENLSLNAEIAAVPTESVENTQPQTGGLLATLSNMISPTVYSQEVQPGQPNAPQSGETVCVDGHSTASPGPCSALGFTLPAGKSTTITFSTVINANTPPATFSVSNQGTVSGSNFTSVLTDDPNVAGAANPTVTRVVQPETIAKAFNPTSIVKDGQSTLTFTITNANPTLVGVPASANPPPTASVITFNDVFPANLVVATPLTVTNNCGGTLRNNGDTANTAVGDAGIRLVGAAAVPPILGNNGTCTVTVKVAATQPGSYPNTSGPVASLEGGTGLASNQATLNVSILTAAGVSVSGRVLTPDGSGLRNAVVVLTDSMGVSRQATTSAFGYYQFDDVESGQNYIIGVQSKHYRFFSRVLSVTDQLTDVDFVGEE